MYAICPDELTKTKERLLRHIIRRIVHMLQTK